MAFNQISNHRIVVVGEGREKFGHVFLADTGTSNGDITGQTRPINTVDFKVRREVMRIKMMIQIFSFSRAGHSAL